MPETIPGKSDYGLQEQETQVWYLIGEWQG